MRTRASLTRAPWVINTPKWGEVFRRQERAAGAGVERGAGRTLLAGGRQRRLSDKGVGGGTGTYVVPLAAIGTQDTIARRRAHHGEERGRRLEAALTRQEVPCCASIRAGEGRWRLEGTPLRGSVRPVEVEGVSGREPEARREPTDGAQALVGGTEGSWSTRGLRFLQGVLTVGEGAGWGQPVSVGEAREEAGPSGGRGGRDRRRGESETSRLGH